MLHDDRVGADPWHLRKGQDTSTYTGPQDDCNQGYGYITCDSFCLCGASLATHEDRTCLRATKDP